jgi:UDP-N-acetylmuramate dehydrogenase
MGFIKSLEEYTYLKVDFDVPMKKYTALGCGGKAKYFIEIDSLHALNLIISLAKSHRVKYKVIGCGTNLLVSDRGFDGLIVCTRNLTDIFLTNDGVKVMAGATVNKLVKFCADKGFTGVEALAGIPATVGGAIVMNAGAFGKNISDKLVTVETVKDGKIKRYFKNECKFTYRGSKFYKSKEAVVSATFSFEESDKKTIAATVKKHLDLRKQMQPAGRSCGSVFKNPKRAWAGALIERAGLKGFSIGGAKVSEKHANFILTAPNVKSIDVYNLIVHVKDKVKSTFGVDLIEEVEYVGEF